MSGGSEPERIPAKMLSANVLPLLGVTPLLGRGFSSDEDTAGGEPVAILSHALWQARFGGRTPSRPNESCSTASPTPSSA